MKILYIAKERRAAELAEVALPAVSPDIAVGWAPDLDDARRWIDANRDVAAIIVEVESDIQRYESFIRRIQAQGVVVPVVVVSVPGYPPAFPALAAVADEIVPKDTSFLNDLPAVVSRALGTRRPASRATAPLTERQSAFDARLADASNSLRTLEQRLNDAATTIEQARRDHAAEAVALAEQHAQRTSELAGQVVEATGIRQQLERQLADQAVALQSASERAAKEQQAHARDLADAIVALEQAREERAADAAVAATRLAVREAELLSRLESAAATTEQLEGRLADADAALHYMEQRTAADEVALHQQKAEWQADIEAERARGEAARQSLEQQLARLTITLQRSEEGRALDAAEAEGRLAEQQAQYDQRLTAAATQQELLQTLLAAADASLQDAEQRRASEAESASAAIDALLGQQAQLAAALQGAEKRLAESDATAAALDAMLADSTAAFRRFEQYHAAEIGEAAARHIDYQKQSEARMAQASATLNVLKVQVGERQARFEAELARENANRAMLTRQLAQAEEAHQEDTLRYASEITAATAARQRVEADASAAAEQAERSLVETVAAMRQRAREQEAVIEERAATTARQLQEQLKALSDGLTEDRRRFDQTPANLARCARDGRIERANPALASLLGYDTPEALRQVDFAAIVFESGDELQWLVDRCLASRKPESIETTWRKEDGSRIVVRVLASATDQDSVDLAAHDITALRSLEEKLRHSQRMEAVGRYASEVALTCDTVLGNVKEEAQRLLAWSDGGGARPQADLMLEDVTRASVLLRRLALYGEKEKNAPALVDLQKVLRDLEPVLRRVAGNQIAFVLPKASRPHNLEVEAERVERILVNLAAYGRERMPLGGRLTFELAPAVVNRTFVEKYPNVRPGAHVLLTVTEKRSAVSDVNGAAPPIVAAPGVDFGTLQALVSDSGGHLWMTAEPSGDMVLKIHLPRRVLDAPEQVASPRRTMLRAA